MILCFEGKPQTTGGKTMTRKDFIRFHGETAYQKLSKTTELELSKAHEHFMIALDALGHENVTGLRQVIEEVEARRLEAEQDRNNVKWLGRHT